MQVFIPPQIRDIISESSYHFYIYEIIEKKKEDPSDVTLLEIKNLLSNQDFIDGNLNSFLRVAARYDQTLLLSVSNEGNAVANNTKLLMENGGIARIGRNSRFEVDHDYFEWTNEIALGNVRPGATIYVNVWPKSYFSKGREALSILSDEGSGSVYDTYKFSGGLLAKFIHDMYKSPMLLLPLSLIILCIIYPITVLIFNMYNKKQKDKKEITSPAA